jgi:hypothetical protein
MALFGGARDISLFQSLNRELINDIIQTEIGYYKFVLEATAAHSNIYGESDTKQFYEPVRIACLITRKDQEWSVDEFGPDMDQGINFALLKDSIKELNLFPEIGDIIIFNNNFFEVDALVENQLLLGKDPDYAISTGATDFGHSHSIILSTHMSRVEKLNLIPLRGGVYPSTESVIEGDTNTAPSGSITSGSL